MDSDLKEVMKGIVNSDRDEIDTLVQSIVKIEKSFKNRSSNKSTRRNQIDGEIMNFVATQKEPGE